MAVVELKPLKPAEAIAAFEERAPRTAGPRGKLGGEAKARAFLVGGLTTDAATAGVFEKLAQALDEGTTFNDFKKAADDILAKDSGWGLTAQDSRGRLETIFRTNVLGAYGAGHYAQATDPDVVKARPIWMYDAVGDDRTRPSHLVLDGRAHPADDAFWKSYYPPNGFNCRCGVITLSAADAQARGLTVSKTDGTPPLGPSGGPVLPDKGFGRPPSHPAAIRETAAKILAEAAPFEKEPEFPRREQPALANDKAPERAPKTIGGAPRQQFRTGFNFGDKADVVAVRDPWGEPAIVQASLLNKVGAQRAKLASFAKRTIEAPDAVRVQLKRDNSGRLRLRRQYYKEFALRDQYMTVAVDASDGRVVTYFDAAQDESREKARRKFAAQVARGVPVPLPGEKN